MQTSKRGILAIIACCVVVLISYEYYQHQNFLETTKQEVVKKPPVVDIRVADPNSLYIGQGKIIGGLSVKLNDFIDDNRCPTDVKCIQAGAASFNVTLEDGTTTRTRMLSSKGNKETLNDYTIAITKVSPERLASKGIPKDTYVVTFNVTKR